MGSREPGYSAGNGPPGIQDLGPQGAPGLPLGAPAYSLPPQHGQMQQISLDQRRGPPQFGPGAGGGVGPAPVSLGLQVLAFTTWNVYKVINQGMGMMQQKMPVQLGGGPPGKADKPGLPSSRPNSANTGPSTPQVVST